MSACLFDEYNFPFSRLRSNLSLLSKIIPPRLIPISLHFFHFFHRQPTLQPRFLKPMTHLLIGPTPLQWPNSLPRPNLLPWARFLPPPLFYLSQSVPLSPIPFSIHMSLLLDIKSSLAMKI